ncbi:MAG: AgmX/PglI C-terminal domain-containing protein, partial [Proteobacteria bacterium]|nr:AgmX/PglI C-terminal domain-containing protein [Pseudomonadota bacterium]
MNPPPKQTAVFGDSDSVGLGGLGPSHPYPSPHGTIGTGYGTLGHGVGGPDGYGPGGGFRRRPPLVPTVIIGASTSVGDLDAAIIKRYIRRNLAKLQYCYEKRLLAEPTLEGSLTAKFVIGEDGKVVTSSATGFDPEVGACVAQVFKDTEFPKPKTGSVTVTYPLKFSRDHNLDDVETSLRPRTPLPPTPPPKVDPPRVDPRALFRTRADRDLSTKDYDPGASNPLRTERAALVACFAPSKLSRAMVLVDLGAAPKVIGADGDPALAACIERVAKTAKPLGTSARCALAFGEMAETELPVIEITAEAVTMSNKSLATVASLSPDTAPTKIAALTAILADMRKLAVAKDAPPLVELLPIVIRPAPATTMK